MIICRTRLFHLMFGLGLGLPSASFAAPVVPASQPLFLEGTVKHNVLLAIDDSGSMDFETLVSANDGAFWLGENGSFLRDDGSVNDAGESGVRSQGAGGKYTYILPNGRSGTYDGRKINNNHQAVPPIKPFAFTRSSEYNRSYYDPNVEYEPWASYGGFTFGDIDPASAPWDIMRNSRSDLNLTTNLNTSTKNDNEWGFDVQDSDMPCTDAGGPCGSTGTEHYNYFPAHYYVVQKTGTYTFDPNAGSSFSAASSVLLEAEDGILFGDYERATDSGSDIFDSALVASASGKDYAGVDDVSSASNSPPTGSQGQIELKFTPKQVGDHVIWLRRYMPDESSDSLWLNLYGLSASDLVILGGENKDFETTSDGEDWNKWWQGHNKTDSWVWEPWAQVNFNSTASTQTLRIRYRESDVYIDQVLITPEAAIPGGPLELLSGNGSSVTRDCATDPSPSHYQEFFADTTQFSGVNAIGPKGECLKRVDIKPAQASYAYIDEDGSTQSRTYDEEITNFANWFTYYRRRHQAMRGGLGSAFQGIGGIQTGLFWINNRRTVSMYDMDDPTDLNAFLDEHYKYVSSGGTPNREALAHAGAQLKRSGSNAPITLECQKNFTLLFTDGFSNDSSISGIGNEDENAGAPYADSYSSNLADIAYKYYTENLRPSLTTGEVRTPAGCNETTPAASLDCNANLHMNSYTVGLGASGTLFGVTHNSVADAYLNPPTWPDTGLRDKRMIDDLYHAAVNGRGEMFNALTPADLRKQLSAALRDIIESIGNSSSVTFNTGTLNEDSLVYSASFNSTAWSGDLEARELNPSTGAVSDTPVWKASDVLDAQSPNQRVILTYSKTSDDGVPFRWDTSVLDTGQVADLNRSPAGTSDSQGAQRLNFIRGARAGEGITFRNRSSVLGDIVHSTPVYVGKPRLAWPDSGSFGVATNRYSKFKNITAASRTPVIYVGANDGMLHGFKAVEDANNDGGKELIAYIPRSIYSSADGAGLNYLTRPDYTHRYYVDLSPQVVDTYIKTTTSGSEDWHSVLIGGLRNGGGGFFAIDVTDPSKFSEANASDLVLWEFTEEDDARLNYTLAEPTVGLMNNGRWAMILGNGPANGSTADDNKTGVFIIYMDGGMDGSWTEGTDYEFISLGSTGGLSMTQPVDLNGDSVIDRIYGGDREGNMWVVNVGNTNSGNWAPAYVDGTSGLPEPLFTAVEGGNPQPIMTRPLVVRNVASPVGTEGLKGEDYMVFFGTGRYFTDGDAANTEQQSFYGVWDRGNAGLDRNDLVKQSISESTKGGKVLRQSGDAAIDWANSAGNGRDYGWYMDLPESGERVINRAQIRGQIVLFETFTPSQSPCEGGGTGWLMSVALDGSNPDEPVFDANNDGVIDPKDADSNGTNYVGEKNSNLGTGGTAFLDDYQYLNDGVPDQREVSTGDSGERTGRLGWQELLAP